MSHVTGIADQDAESDRQLIRMTEEYLQERLRRVAPDSLLVLAWEKFFHVYDQIIRRFVGACGAGGGDLEDCVQDVWTAVVRELQHARWNPDRSGFRTWLYAIVRNKTADLVRGRMRRPVQPLDATVAGVPDDEPGPAETLEAGWERGTVQAVMEQLQMRVSPLSFRVFCLRRLEERGVSEVAALLGLTSEQVRARDHRAQKKFRILYDVFTGRGLGQS